MGCLPTRFTAGFFSTPPFQPERSRPARAPEVGGRVVPGIGQKVDNCKGKPGKRKKPKTIGRIRKSNSKASKVTRLRQTETVQTRQSYLPAYVTEIGLNLG